MAKRTLLVVNCGHLYVYNHGDKSRLVDYEVGPCIRCHDKENGRGCMSETRKVIDRWTK